MTRKKRGERQGKGGMNSDGQHEEKKVRLRTSKKKNIEPELIINQILMLIQITGKRRLGIAIKKQMW
jgi:hypothetical protein